MNELCLFISLNMWLLLL